MSPMSPHRSAKASRVLSSRVKRGGQVTTPSVGQIWTEACRQLGMSKANCLLKSFARRKEKICNASCLIESECLLVKVTKQMKRLDRNISTFEATLQETPKVLDAVGMNLTV